MDLLRGHAVTDESLHIEAKGKTTQIGLDFRAGLGQMVQRMDSVNCNYGFAIPDIPEFRQ